MPKSSLRIPALLALTALTTTLTLLAGCGEALPDAPSPAQLVRQGIQTPPLYVQYCVDRTGSYYPSVDFKSANQYLATSLMQRAGQPGQGATTVYVTLIGANTYGESATVNVIQLPATMPEATFVPDQSQGNMFEAATSTAVAHQAQATVTAVQAQAQTQVQQAKTSAAQAGAFLQSLAPTVDYATDINGCFQAAQDHFSHAPQNAQKVVIVASDLQDTVAGQPQPVTLKGAEVLVINFKCDEAAQCTSGTKPTWYNALTKDGATSVQFFDPADSRAQFGSGGLFPSSPSSH